MVVCCSDALRILNSRYQSEQNNSRLHDHGFSKDRLGGLLWQSGTRHRLLQRFEIAGFAVRHCYAMRVSAFQVIHCLFLARALARFGLSTLLLALSDSTYVRRDEGLESHLISRFLHALPPHPIDRLRLLDHKDTTPSEAGCAVTWQGVSVKIRNSFDGRMAACFKSQRRVVCQAP